ncbi:hypothetical protein CJ030_MR4G023935 [Morella rubra]|uniref:Uncharacterized protein n=1 Tax=Morella rubra TaxID=262757 RepID=A0A6A1VTD4_9ROSI|nr:hypothetical protein CJ030_MR4G023935 [Morella rubra]
MAGKILRWQHSVPKILQGKGAVEDATQPARATKLLERFGQLDDLVRQRRRRHASGRKTSLCDSSVRAEVVRYTSSVGPSLRIGTNYRPYHSQSTTSGIRQVRGSTRGIALLKAHIEGKLIVHIPDGRIGGDDKASSMLSSHIGALVRQHVPFETSKQKEVPDEVKSYVMNRVLDDFQLDHD